MKIQNPFAIMPVEVFRDERLSKTDLRVLGTLMSFMTPEKLECWPKRKTISERCGLPESKISTATSRLVKFGWLRKEGDGGKSCSCKYIFILPTRLDKSMPDIRTDPNSSTLINKDTQRVTISGRGKKETTNKPIDREGLDEGFDQFWVIYPRKCNLQEAMDVWKDLAPNQNLQKQIIASVIASSTKNPQWLRENGRFIPYPSKYLRDRRWEDQLPPTYVIGANNTHNNDYLLSGPIHDNKKPPRNRREHAANINETLDGVIISAQ